MFQHLNYCDQVERGHIWRTNMAKTVHKIIKNTQNNEVIIRWDIFQYVSFCINTSISFIYIFFNFWIYLKIF